MNYTTETETKIIRAATKVFSNKGKAGARMQEIADQAGINKAMLHYYFRSKDQLYGKVFEEQVQNMFAEFVQAFADDSGNIEHFLRRFIDRYIDAISRHPQVMRFVMWEIEEGGDRFVNAIQMTLNQYGLDDVPLVGRFQQAISAGEIRSLDPYQLTISLIGLCVYPFLAQPILEKLFQVGDITHTQFLEKRKTEIFDLLWNGIKPETE